MKYNVYGVGNALVDCEFEVTDAFLGQHDIEKGMMTLVDEDKHHVLMGELSKEFGIKKRAGGGSAANTMVAISQLGGSTFYACKVADDETGRFYESDLHEAGVHTKISDVIKQEGSTGKCMVMVTPDAERTMNTYLGITADFSEEELHLEELSNADYLYIEGYLVTSDVSRAAAVKAKKLAQEQNVKVAMTFSDPSMVTYFREGVDEVFGDGVDVLFCNSEELQTFAGSDSLDEAVAQVSSKVGKLVVTLGPEGAMIVTGDSLVRVGGEKVEAVDTNGAGDMFAGAFMYGLSQGMDDMQAGTLASKAAAQVVTVFGARLPQETYQSLLKELG